VIKSAFFVAFAGVLCLITASGAAAEPINILSGSLVFATNFSHQVGPLSLTGTDGFSVVGGIDLGENLVGPFPCTCQPSSTEDIGGPPVVGSGFSGTNVTFEGRTFLNVGSGNSEAELALQFLGTVALPALGQSPIVLTAPFRLQDQRSFFFPGFPFHSVPIRGGGIATIGLEPLNGLWELQNARYDFAAQATPEPATLLLIASGLAGLAFRSRRQRSV